MSDISIEGATRADIDFIVQCNRAMADETEDLGLDATVLRGGISYLLEHSAEGFYLVARRDDVPVGTLMVTYEWSDWRNGRFWWIQSVYVLPEARRQGVYRALHDAVRQAASRDARACGIRLYVERENLTAQQTYREIGMEETHYRLYEELF